MDCANVSLLQLFYTSNINGTLECFIFLYRGLCDIWFVQFYLCVLFVSNTVLVLRGGLVDRKKNCGGGGAPMGGFAQGTIQASSATVCECAFFCNYDWLSHCMPWEPIFSEFFLTRETNWATFLYDALFYVEIMSLMQWQFSLTNLIVYLKYKKTECDACNTHQKVGIKRLQVILFWN